MDETELRDLMCHIGRLMHQNHFIDGAGGNISVRISKDRILTTPSGVSKGFMTPEQMIVVDMEGNVVGPNIAEQRPTSELIMHLECYHQRSDIEGVIHAHPPTVIALSIAGLSFTDILLPEVVMLMGTVPTLSYAAPRSEANRQAIASSIQTHDTIILAYHGSLTVATRLWDAYLRLESLEHSAKIIYMVNQLGGPKSVISPEQILHLIDIREKLGLLRPGQREKLVQLTK